MSKWNYRGDGMERDTATILKILAVIVTLMILFAVLSWLTDPAIAQTRVPITQTLDITLVRDTGLVYSTFDEAKLQPIGVWNQWSLPTQRLRPGRHRLIETLCDDGSYLLFAMVMGVPARSDGDEGLYLAAIERQGSLWYPLNGGARLWDLGSGNYRIVVVLVLSGTEGR